MKKIVALALLIVAIAGQLKAQDIVKGDLAFLKGDSSINITFVYDKLTVGNEGKEANYIKKKKAEKDAKEPGKGDEWEKSWLGDRKKHYEPKFIELFSKYSELKVGEDVPAKYTMVVETKFIEPGYNVGISSGSAVVNIEISIYDPANMKKALCKILMDEVKGGRGQFDAGMRIGEAYAKAGKEMGKLVDKKIR